MSCNHNQISGFRNKSKINLSYTIGPRKNNLRQIKAKKNRWLTTALGIWMRKLCLWFLCRLIGIFFKTSPKEKSVIFSKKCRISLQLGLLNSAGATTRNTKLVWGRLIKLLNTSPPKYKGTITKK